MTQFGGLFPAWGGVVRSAGEDLQNVKHKNKHIKKRHKNVTFFDV